MRKLSYSLTLALLLVATLAFTVYSQRSNTASPASEIQILEGGVHHTLPVDITLVVPTESGPQTVTVPIMLNLNLTVGPVDAIHLEVEAEQAQQAVSPLRVVEPITASAELTDSEALTDTSAD